LPFGDVFEENIKSYGIVAFQKQVFRQNFHIRASQGWAQPSAMGKGGGDGVLTSRKKALPLMSMIMVSQV